MGQYGSASGGSLSASVESYALDAGQRVAAERDGLPKGSGGARWGGGGGGGGGGGAAVRHLGVRHRARLEPAVEDFVDAAERAAALGGRQLDAVEELTVDVVADLLARPLLELLDRADDDGLLAVGRDPHRDRRPPEAVAAHL